MDASARDSNGYEKASLESKCTLIYSCQEQPQTDKLIYYYSLDEGGNVRKKDVLERQRQQRPEETTTVAIEFWAQVRLH